MSWSTSELRVRLALLNRFKPSGKIFYWLFQGVTSFVDLSCFFLSCVCYVFVRVCLYVLCGQLLGKGWPLGSSLWCLTVNLSLSHWYLGSGVVLNCSDSWSLHPYLLSFTGCKKCCLRPLHALPHTFSVCLRVHVYSSRIYLLHRRPKSENSNHCRVISNTGNNAERVHKCRAICQEEV